MFQEALARLDAGEADGLCPARLDRFSRSTLEGLALAQRLRDAGHALLLPDLDLDTSTPTGKAMLAVALAFAQLELDQRRENWAAAQRRAMERGVYPGTTPLGYIRDKDGQDADRPGGGAGAPARVRRPRCGLSWSKLARQLDAELPREDGQRWRPATVKAILDSPLYLGRLERSRRRHADCRRGRARAARRPRPVRGGGDPRGTGPEASTAAGDAGGARTLRLLRGRLDARRASERSATARRSATTRTCARSVASGWRGSRRRRSTPTCSARCTSGWRTPRHVDASLRNGGEREAGGGGAGRGGVGAVARDRDRERNPRLGGARRDDAHPPGGVDAARLELARAVSSERASGPAHADLIEALEQGDDGQRNTILRTKLASVTVQKAGTPGKRGNLAERVRIVWADEHAAQDAGEFGDEPVGERAPVAA